MKFLRMIWEGRDGERPKTKKGFRKERVGLGLVNLWSVVNREGWGLLGQGVKTLWSKGIAYCATFNRCSYFTACPCCNGVVWCRQWVQWDFS